MELADLAKERIKAASVRVALERATDDLKDLRNGVIELESEWRPVGEALVGGAGGGRVPEDARSRRGHVF